MSKWLYIGGSLVLLHLILSEQRKNQPTIHYLDNLPFNHDGMTIPPVGIFIKKDQQQNEALLKHEMVHWQQYQRMGLVPYYLNYFTDMATKGYDAHPMELEARENETAYCKENYTECVRNGKANTVFNPIFRS